MSAEEILKLIESVDVEDTAALDEIDARVWCSSDCSLCGVFLGGRLLPSCVCIGRVVGCDTDDVWFCVG